VQGFKKRINEIRNSKLVKEQVRASARIREKVEGGRDR